MALTVEELASVYAKIARAEEHVGALHAELEAWGQLRPYKGVSEFNADYTRLAFRSVANRNVTLDRASMILGDCVHNLRAALDHLTYAIARHQHYWPAPFAVGKAVGFIVADDEPSFREQVRSKRLEYALYLKTIEAMESMQPYRRLYGPSKWHGVIAFLHALNIADKHHSLLDLFIPGGAGHFKVIDNPDGAKVTAPLEPVERFEDGKELYVVTFDRPAPRMKYDFQLQFSVAVDCGGRAGYLPNHISPVMADEVREIVRVVSAAV